MNTELATKGAANQNNITNLHGRILNIGIIISPIPIDTNNNGGPIFYKFSLDISKKSIILEVKKPFSKKFTKKNATLIKYNEGANIVAAHDKPIINNVSTIILLKIIFIFLLQSSPSELYLLSIVKCTYTATKIK
jgi:hypothetical protein